jgi:hypothetical protein
MRPAPVPVHGIPCFLGASMRREIGGVLVRIRNRCRADYQDIIRLVREIKPVSAEEAADGTQGEWRADQGRSDDPSTWSYGIDRTPGVLLLLDEYGDMHTRAVIAPEFGHVCTRMGDRNRRGCIYAEEWISELAADWYAYKWGFGRLIARHRKHRDWGHHAPAPGSTFTVTHDDTTCRFRVTRSFCVRLIGSRRRARRKTENS